MGGGRLEVRGRGGKLASKRCFSLANLTAVEACPGLAEAGSTLEPQEVSDLKRQGRENRVSSCYLRGRWAQGKVVAVERESRSGK